MAHGAQAAKATTEKRPQRVQRVQGAGLLLLQPTCNPETKLSDDKVAELAMFLLM